MKPRRATSPEVTGGTRENINAIRAIEREAHRDTTAAERVGTTVVRIVTHPAVLSLHALAVVLWIILNRTTWLWVMPIDPYPYPMLGLALSCEAIILAVVILLNQRHQTRVEEHFEHLNLQVTLLAEQEATKILQSLARICEHLNIPNSAADDREVQEMAKKTPIAALAMELRQGPPPAEGDVLQNPTNPALSPRLAPQP